MTAVASWRFSPKLGILVAISIVLLAVAVWACGVSPTDALARLWDSAFGNSLKFSTTLKETTPLLLAGLAVYIALRAGLFNIGVEGQITIGALCAAAVALAVPNAFGALLAALAGSVGGALWALPAGWIKAYRGGHEVISTIMLNNIASGLTLALVAGPFKDPAQEGTTSREIVSAARVPDLLRFGDLQVSAVLPIALVILAALAIWLKRTVAGFELRLSGENPRAAQVAGVDVKATVCRAMMASGALAGLTGAFLVLAYEHRFFQGISSGYGFDALGVAMLAGSQPLIMLGSALLFGVLNKGSASLQLLGIPKGITWIVLGLLIVCFAAVRYRRAQETEN